MVYAVCLAAGTRLHEDKRVDVGFQKKDFQTAITKYCLDCHEDTADADTIDLTPFANDSNEVELIGASRVDVFRKMQAQLESSAMPPSDAEPLPELLRNQMSDWIRKEMKRIVGQDGYQPPVSPIRRLTQFEYKQTIRDLLHIEVNVASQLPEDIAGGEGFDRTSETLTISPLHTEMYLQAAKDAVAYMKNDERARSRIFLAKPDQISNEPTVAKKVLEQFLYRSFRRKPTEEEIDRWVNHYLHQKESGRSHIESVCDCMEGILISPSFLFLIERTPEDQSNTKISADEIASRLSYFLWSSMPDQTLMKLASNGHLLSTEILKKQTIRMLKDRKARAFAENFVGQWLGIRDLGRKHRPERSLYRRYNQELEAAMRYEPIFLFEEIVREDRPVLDLIDCDYTYVNNHLARFYNMKPKLDQALREQPLRITLEKDSNRGGVLTMASVLAITSHPSRTSPVLRGKWILDTILGTPPPSPPPNIPSLSENKSGEEPKSLRDRLLAHRENPNCASCHDRIDPLGFGLEHYDAIGQYRTNEFDLPIDASGQLPNGDVFSGAKELKQVLLKKKKTLIQNLTRRMMGYALGRSLSEEDLYIVDTIVESFNDSAPTSHQLIIAIVTSEPFLTRGVHSVDK